MGKASKREKNGAQKSNQKVAKSQWLTVLCALLAVFLAVYFARSWQKLPSEDSNMPNMDDWWERNAHLADSNYAEKAMQVYVNRGAESLLRIETLNKNGNLVRGTVVTKNVRKGEVLLKLPAQEVVDHQNIIASKIGYVFDGETSATPRRGSAPAKWFTDVDHVEAMIVLYMMWMAVNPESLHHEYGVLLQSSDTPLKYLWKTEEEAVAVGGEMLQRFRAVIRYDINLTWDLIVQPLKNKHPEVFDGPHYSHYNFTRWYSVYRSRSFVSSNMCMVPILDLLNHGSQANCAHQFMPNGDMILKATRDLTAGEEAVHTYSNNCREWFYSFFGYQENVNICTTGQQPNHRNGPLSAAAKQISGIGSSISERPRYWLTDETRRWSRGLLDSATT